MSKEKQLQIIKQLLDAAENNIRQVKNLLFATEVINRAKDLNISDDGNKIEGIFDGEFMVDSSGKKYPVSANYASKSKLLPGDMLKLSITDEGMFLFKQIGPVKRKKLIGTLEMIDSNKCIVKTPSGSYKILQASVTYFKANIGSKMTVSVPEECESEWAALENVIID